MRSGAVAPYLVVHISSVSRRWRRAEHPALEMDSPCGVSRPRAEIFGDESKLVRFVILLSVRSRNDQGRPFSDALSPRCQRTGSSGGVGFSLEEPDAFSCFRLQALHTKGFGA